MSSSGSITIIISSSLSDRLMLTNILWIKDFGDILKFMYYIMPMEVHIVVSSTCQGATMQRQRWCNSPRWQKNIYPFQFVIFYRYAYIIYAPIKQKLIKKLER